MTPEAPPSRRALVLLLAALAVLWFAGIDQRALINPDEGRYAEIAREMAVSGDWLTPRLNGLKYFEKPPLQYWVTAAAFGAFGIGEGTARLWPVLSTFLAVLFLGYVGLRLGGPRLGLYAVATLAGCAGFIINAHLLTLDGGLAAFLTIAFGAFVLAQRDDASPGERRRWMWLAWAAMAGATLSKGLIGVLIPGATLVLYTLATRDFAVWRRLHLVSGLAVYLALTVPWFVAVSRANDEFFEFFFVNEHFRRYLTTEHRRVEPWWYFIPVFLVGMLPWLPVLGWGALRAWRDAPAGGNGFSWRRFALVWAAFVMVFFSASGSKLPSYILPMFPVLSLVAAALLAGIEPATLVRITRPPVVAAVALLAGMLVGYEPLVRRFVPDGDTLGPALAFGPWVKAAVAVATLGGVYTLVTLRGPSPPPRRLDAAVVATSLSMLAAVQIGIIGYDEFRTTRSSRDMLRAAAAANGPFAADVPFYHVHMYDQTVPFYLGRTTTFVAYRDEFALGQDAEPGKAIADDATWAALWKSLPQAYAMMPVADFERFSAAGLPMRPLARDGRRVIVSRQ